MTECAPFTLLLSISYLRSNCKTFYLAKFPFLSLASPFSPFFAQYMKMTWIRLYHPRTKRLLVIRINRAYVITASNRKAQTALAFRAREVA